MHIITHRGLDPSKEKYYLESSLEAFSDQLSRGFGLEFDLQLTKDNKIIISHDVDLFRISQGKNKTNISDLNLQDILSMDFDGSHLTSLDTLLDLINEKQSPDALSAIHIKHHLQASECLDIILSYLKNRDTSKFILFDIKIETAEYLKKHNKNLQLAPAVSHPFDIKRYNSVVGGTLLSVNEIINKRDLFDWVWLDEWDLIDENNQTKKFYTKDIFESLKSAGFKIAIVTPELHGTSPGLLGGEVHFDTLNKTTLFARIKEIIELTPEAICTDYPDRSKELLMG